MNPMYRLPSHSIPAVAPDAADQYKKFKLTPLDEVQEIEEILDLAEAGADPMGIAVAVADLPVDIVVYFRSEALKYRLPLEQVLDIIMNSNESKLGADGNPTHDTNDKFLTVASYWKPESKILELFRGVSTYVSASP